MAVTAISIQGAGAFMGAIGARSAAQGNKIGMQYRADIADINAKMDEQQINSVLLTSERQQSRVMLKGAQVKSSQRVAAAANGIDLQDSETVDRQLASTEFMKQTDALMINQNAVQQAEALRMKKTNDLNDARMSRATADAINPNMALTSTLMQGVGSVASNWYMMNKMGSFGDTNNYKLDFSSMSGGNSGGIGLKPSAAWGFK
jgi:hypothetical protein